MFEEKGPYAVLITSEFFQLSLQILRALQTEQVGAETGKKAAFGGFHSSNRPHPIDLLDLRMFLVPVNPGTGVDSIKEDLKDTWLKNYECVSIEKSFLDAVIRASGIWSGFYGFPAVPNETSRSVTTSKGGIIFPVEICHP